MVENMLIWHVVIYARFRCVALILVASHPNFVMSDHHRKNFFRWLLSVLFCCWNSTSNTFGDSNGNSGRGFEEDRIEMGPLTFEEYINTLEPYDPQVHGWRGEEPWRHRMRRDSLPSQKMADFKNNNCRAYDFHSGNHVIYHETPV